MSYNQGLAVGAGLELWRANHNPTVLATVRVLADSAIASPLLVSNGVLTESCDTLDRTGDDDRKGERWSGADNAAFPNARDWRTQASALSALIAVIPTRRGH